MVQGADVTSESQKSEENNTARQRKPSAWKTMHRLVCLFRERVLLIPHSPFIGIGVDALPLIIAAPRPRILAFTSSQLAKARVKLSNFSRRRKNVAPRIIAATALMQNLQTPLCSSPHTESQALHFPVSAPFTPALTVVGCARVRTDQQREKENIKTQVERCYVERGYKLIEMICDDGVSETLTPRRMQTAGTGQARQSGGPHSLPWRPSGQRCLYQRDGGAPSARRTGHRLPGRGGENRFVVTDWQSDVHLPERHRSFGTGEYFAEFARRHSAPRAGRLLAGRYRSLRL